MVRPSRARSALKENAGSDGVPVRLASAPTSKAGVSGRGEGAKASSSSATPSEAGSSAVRPRSPVAASGQRQSPAKSGQAAARSGTAGARPKSGNANAAPSRSGATGRSEKLAAMRGNPPSSSSPRPQSARRQEGEVRAAVEAGAPRPQTSAAATLNQEGGVRVAAESRPQRAQTPTTAARRQEGDAGAAAVARSGYDPRRAGEAAAAALARLEEATKEALCQHVTERGSESGKCTATATSPE